MQEPADVADSEKSSSIQEGQNLNQDVWWQPAAHVIKHLQKRRWHQSFQSSENDTTAFMTESNTPLMVDVRILLI